MSEDYTPSMKEIRADYVAGEVVGTATAEIGTNLWDWMREKDQA